METQDHNAPHWGFTSFGLLRRLSVLATLVILFGCATTALTAKDETAINDGDKAIVLVRVLCSIDGQPFEPCIFRRHARILSDNIFIGFALGSFDTFGDPKGVVNQILSDESYEEGWTFFVLSPGIYYLYVRGPDSSEISKRASVEYYTTSFRDAPRWRIDVPDRARWIYAGTLTLAGKVEGILLFGDEIITPVSNQELPLRDDSDSANKLLTTHFPKVGEVQTILMRQWYPGAPFIFRSPLPGKIK